MKTATTIDALLMGYIDTDDFEDIKGESDIYDKLIAKGKNEETVYKISMFRQKQGLPYEAKVIHAETRAREFYNKIHSTDFRDSDILYDCHVSVGGLDSITLLCFLRSIGINVPAISISSLEDKSIQRVHEKLGVISIPPYKSKENRASTKTR